MFSPYTLPSIRIATALLALLSVVSAHMEMTSPPPRGSKNNKLWTGEIDYSLTSPLSGPGAFPCQGKPQGPSVATFNAGGSIPVTIGGSAVHGGGHCEFSVRYPGQSKFVVLKRVLGTCLIDSLSYSVDLPASLPSCVGCAFAWSWINAVGNREYYMNCADVDIKGVSGGSFTGDELLVGNLAGLGPTFPEFGGGKDDGSQNYNNRPQVTVSGSGGGAVPAPAPIPTPPSEPDTDPDPDTAPVPTPPAAPEKPVPTTPSKPTTPSTPPDTQCTGSERKCTVQGLLACRRGRFVNTGMWCADIQP